jgi:peptide/nickel transport system permease protein
VAVAVSESRRARIASRLARGAGRVVATAALSCLLAWTLAELAPGTPAERAAAAAGSLPPLDAPPSARAAAVERAARIHDLHGSAPGRVVRAVARAALLDFGRSWRDRRPATTVVARALPTTLQITGLALLLALLSGALTGAALARTRTRPISLLGGLALAAAASIPPAWLAFLLLDTHGATARLLAAALILAVAPAAEVAVQVRNTLTVFLASPLATAIRARGAAESRVTLHGVAASIPALAPLLTSVGALTLGASVIVERAFALPGLGTVTLDAASRGDAPILACVATLAGALLATLSLTADLLTTIDPRGRTYQVGPTS